MNVKDAIAQMVRNPAVDFPWEGTVINLINGFLPPGNQLDPLTTQAGEVQTAVESLEPGIRDMVYSSNIGPGSFTSPLPPPASQSSSKAGVFKLFAIVVIVVSVVLTINTGTLTSGDGLELIKILIGLFTGKDPGGGPPGP